MLLVPVVLLTLGRAVARVPAAVVHRFLLAVKTLQTTRNIIRVNETKRTLNITSGTVRMMLTHSQIHILCAKQQYVTNRIFRLLLQRARTNTADSTLTCTYF